MLIKQINWTPALALRRRRGRVVIVSDPQYGSPRFKSYSVDLLDLLVGHPVFKSSPMVVNNQLVASCQLGFFNRVMLYLNYMFLSI